MIKSERSDDNALSNASASVSSNASASSSASVNSSASRSKAVSISSINAPSAGNESHSPHVAKRPRPEPSRPVAPRKKTKSDNDNNGPGTQNIDEFSMLEIRNPLYDLLLFITCANYILSRKQKLPYATNATTIRSPTKDADKVTVSNEKAPGLSTEDPKQTGEEEIETLDEERRQTTCVSQHIETHHDDDEMTAPKDNHHNADKILQTRTTVSAENTSEENTISNPSARNVTKPLSSSYATTASTHEHVPDPSAHGTVALSNSDANTTGARETEPDRNTTKRVGKQRRSYQKKKSTQLTAKNLCSNNWVDRIGGTCNEFDTYWDSLGKEGQKRWIELYNTEKKTKQKISL
ncbi:hypothetical protein JOM56_012983 [Amanita muscaria]